MPLAKILYDGWPLAYAPNSPAALHLLALLEAQAQMSPEGEPAWVALPAPSFQRLSAGVQTLLEPTPSTASGRLAWEQRSLPRLARQAGARLLHQVGGGLPLWGGPAAIFSPAGFPPGKPAPTGLQTQRGLAARLGEALGQGGQARARKILWPDDLPNPPSGAPLRRLPPAVHPLFGDPLSAGGFSAGALSANAFSGDAHSGDAQAEIAALELPETYVLYHGPGDLNSLRGLLEAWSWAAGVISDNYPLLLIGLDSAAQDRLNQQLAGYQLTQTARPLPGLSLPALAALYQGCSALFQPVGATGWGDPLRLALAAGRPVVGLEIPPVAALAGPAAYLVDPTDYPASRRLLGAALITILVEEGLAAHLSEAAVQRAAAWGWDPFVSALREIYQVEA